MNRFLFCILFLLATSAVRAQEKDSPAPERASEEAEAMSEGRIRFVRDPGGHAGKPLEVAFSPDGKKLFSFGQDRTLQAWDLTTYERLRVFHLPMGLNGNSVLLNAGKPLVVDRQGERVAFCMRAKDARGMQRVHWAYNGGYLEKSTDGAWTEHNDNGKFYFAEARRTNGEVELFDKSRNYSIILYWNRATIKRGKGNFQAWQAGTWDYDSTFVCSLKTGQAQVLHRAGPRDFTPDGKSLAVAENTSIRIVDIATDKPLVIALKATGKSISRLIYSPDGKTLAALAVDRKVYLLDGATLKLRRSMPAPGAVGVTWADDHTLVLSCSPKEKTLLVLDADTGKEKHAYAFAEVWNKPPKGANHTISVEAIVGTTQAFIKARQSTGAGAWPTGGFLFDWATGKAAKAFSHYTFYQTGGPAIAPDLSVAAVGVADNNAIVLWDPKEGKALMHGRTARTLRAPIRGAVGDYGSVRWFTDEAVSWSRIGGGLYELKLDALTIRSVSPKERQAANKQLAKAIRGNAQPNEEWVRRQMYERGIKQKSEQFALVQKWPNLEFRGGAQPATINFNAMGWNSTFVANDRVVINAFTSPYVYVYDAAGKRLFGTRVAYSDMGSLAVSPNRRYVVIGSLDQTLTIFNPATGKLLLTIFPAGADWIAWTPEGYFAGTPGGERLMGWHVENGPDKLASFYPAERFRKQFRPDVIKLLLEKGSVAEAVKAANAALPPDVRPKGNAIVNVAKLLPPRTTLKLLSANAQGVVQLTTDVVSEPGSEGIESLQVMVDGRPVSGAKFVKEYNKPQARIHHPWPDLQVPPGKHKVVVLASTAESSFVSNVLEIDTRLAQNRPTMHVLAIGVSKYKDTGLDLSCAANDARLIADTFSQCCKGPLFGDVRKTVLSDQKATRKVIIDAIAGLRTDPKDKVKEGDLVIVFFAGHGVKEKEEFFLLPHDTVLGDLKGTALSGADLKEELRALPCQVLLMMDACQAAGYGANGKLRENNLAPATDAATKRMTDDKVGVAVMCAAMGNEKAIERNQNGLFTKAVAAALSAKGGVPFNPVNQKQYLHHLQSFVFDQVTAESDDRQHPFLHLPWVVESFPLRKVP